MLCFLLLLLAHDSLVLYFSSSLRFWYWALTIDHRECTIKKGYSRSDSSVCAVLGQSQLKLERVRTVDSERRVWHWRVFFFFSSGWGLMLRDNMTRGSCRVKWTIGIWRDAVRTNNGFKRFSVLVVSTSQLGGILLFFFFFLI